MATSQQVTLNTSTPSLLASCTAAPALKTLIQAASVPTQIQIYLGGSGVTTTNGFQLALSTQTPVPLELTLQPGDSLYGIASTGTPVVEVLAWEDGC